MNNNYIPQPHSLFTCPNCGESKIIYLIPFRSLWIEDMDDETRVVAYHDPQGFMDAWYTSIKEIADAKKTNNVGWLYQSGALLDNTPQWVGKRYKDYVQPRRSNNS